MPFCSNCGARLNDGAKFCSECGESVGKSSDAYNAKNLNLTKGTDNKRHSLGEVAGAFASSIRSVADTAKQAISSAVSQEQHGNQELAEPPTQTPPIPSIPQPIINNTRQQEYAGTILKCPNCGATITHTTAICPDCGYRITGQTAVSSIRAFNEQLMSIEATRKKPGLGSAFGVTVDPADQKKLSLVRSFPIPNGIDDIVEFMMLAIANIDVGLSKNTVMNRYRGAAKSGESNLTMPKTISDAWVQKMQQAYQKAQMAFPNDPAFSTVQQIYSDKMKELKIKIK